MIEFSALSGQRLNDPTQQNPAQVNKQMFLELLVTQLRSQDPFEPVKNEDFLAQLAQFSSLESLNNIYDEVSTANVLQGSVHNALSTSLIGNYGVTSGNTITVEGDRMSDVIFAMPEAGTARVTIRNASGDVVRTFEVDADRGDHLVSWDGRNDSGQRVEDGEYTVSVEITSGSATGQEAEVYRIGRIRAVRFFGGSPVIVLDDREVMLSDLLEVAESLPEGEAPFDPEV